MLLVLVLVLENKCMFCGGISLGFFKIFFYVVVVVVVGKDWFLKLNETDQCKYM